MAQKLTLTHARKILGKLAESVSNEELEREIEMAELLKSLYFNYNSSHKLSNSVYNKEKDGKI